eukprot:NODE_957_length_2903_cov_0.370542.p4 type:complete len:116 gc:universal NODE_957_length_2903_cov_0.370542:434-87(-)
MDSNVLKTSLDIDVLDVEAFETVASVVAVVFIAVEVLAIVGISEEITCFKKESDAFAQFSKLVMFKIGFLVISQYFKVPGAAIYTLEMELLYKYKYLSEFISNKAISPLIWLEFT